MSACGYCRQGVDPTDAYVLRAFDNVWHKECFKCAECGARLFSFSKFFDRGDGFPLCNNCNSSSSPTCFCCRRPINVEHVITNGKHVHNECFKCAKCVAPLKEDFFEDGGQFWHLSCIN